ncbi:MAG TPA: hypothetical protein VMM76_17860 [Pirellulaceae bacterium]|nr:hypothetical protein [Pirellulaceae bacterium]
MNRLVSRSCIPIAAAFLIGSISLAAFAGGKSKSCHQCGCEKHVKEVCRLVKVCEEVDIPNYVYAKEDVFYPDKGAVCYTAYRSDTIYSFWRTCDCSKVEAPLQQSAPYCPPHLNCSSYTVCGCQTLYGAKPTGCHSGCSIRVPGKTQRITTPILKWETVPLCKDCCDSGEKK